jgi:undecaprenyl-diphosphatase
MDLISLIKAVVMGFVEGLTEFLPVSSTAHLILLGQALGFNDPSGAFKIMIQFGAVLAIITLYFGKIWSTVTALPTSAEARRFAAIIVLAFLPAAFAGVLLGDLIGEMFLEGSVAPEALRVIAGVLILGGAVMLLVERFRPVADTHEMEKLPFWKALLVGCCQAIALIPGVSRSGATIVGAMLLGVERRAAAEFSFFLAMPTMLGAFSYSLYKSRDQLDFSQLQNIGVGFVAAFVAGLIVVRLFLGIVSRYGFWPFAWYRIALGGVIFALVGAGL